MRREPITPQGVAARIVLLVAVILLSWLALLMGQQFTVAEAGRPSPQTFVAEEDFTIEDVEETERLRQAARDSVAPVYRHDDAVDRVVVEEIRTLFNNVRQATELANAVPLPVVTTTTTTPPATLPETTTTLAATTVVEAAEEETEPAVSEEETEETEETDGGPDEEETEPASPAEPSRTSGISGRIIVDANLDVVFTEGIEEGLGDVRIVAYDSTGVQFVTNTSPAGAFSITGMAAGPATILIDTATVHERLTTTTDQLLQLLELEEGLTTTLDPVPMWIQIPPRQTRVEVLQSGRHLLSDNTISILVSLAEGDVLREILGKQSWLSLVEQETAQLAGQALNQNGGISNEELADVRQDYRQRTVFLQLPDSDPDLWRAVSGVVTEVATALLQANKTVDDVEMGRLQEEAAAEVEPAVVEYRAGTIIVEEGEIITEEDTRILDEAGLAGFGLATAPGYIALLVVVVLVVGLLGLYIQRFRPLVWGSFRRFSLVGLLLVLATFAARGPALLIDTNPAVGFLIPAAAFGLMSAILFDARIAVLFTVATGSMTAVATLDPAYTLFAILSTLTPVLFVSAISSRGALRMAVLYMVGGLAVLAWGIGWFFQVDASLWVILLFGALNGFVSGLVGSALLSFLEIAFDLTTSLRLLDLTDRNHPALRLLEEKALGTFNHSLMVGTLADRAARNIDANPLLARAAAYYHDLGKTNNPHYFIENQFDARNPHDYLSPEQSAEVIRQHVRDGVGLARKFRIPSDVSRAVLTHHGDAVMRFFHNKAVERYGAEAVNVEDYRHIGYKPESKEMAIVMIADSVEGACRAVFQQEEATEEKIADLVGRVVGEKQSDGQLSRSDLTLGDLTAIKEAMVEALVGYYHQRIAYPNFPDASGEAPQAGFPADGPAGM